MYGLLNAANDNNGSRPYASRDRTVAVFVAFSAGLSSRSL